MPFASTTPARTTVGCRNRVTITAWSHILAAVFGKTKSSSLFGHDRRCSLSVFTTTGPIGIVRSPASDFGLPIFLYRSARRRTCSSPLSRSTSSQDRPRNSELRRPLNMTVTSSRRIRPGAAWTMARISSGVGISTPTFGFFLSRLLVVILTARPTFCATLPRTDPHVPSGRIANHRFFLAGTRQQRWV